MAIVAEADTTQVSQAQFEAQDEAPPGIEVNVQGAYCKYWNSCGMRLCVLWLYQYCS